MNGSVVELEDAKLMSVPPDMTVINAGRRAPPPLPLSVFGPWADWLAAAAESKGAPVDYVAGTLLVSAAACIGNARRVQAWDGWTEPCILWIQAIGDPGTGKSPAADAVLDPLKLIESDLAEDMPSRVLDYETRKEEARAVTEIWKQEVKNAVDAGLPPPQKPERAVEPEKPVRPRIRISDATPEAVALLMSVMPRGLCMVRDELAGWFESFGRYGNDGERAMWLEAWGGRSYTVDRVKRENEPIRIPHLSISAFGGLQPDRLSSSLLAGDDDGLQARFLCLWPDPVPPTRPDRPADARFVEYALRRLHGLEMAVDESDESYPVVLELTPAAADLFHKWRLEHGADRASGMFGSHLSKLPGYVLRLACVLEHLWWSIGSDPEEPSLVSDKAVTAACGLVDGYFKPMAERTYGDAALSKEDRLAAALARHITRKGVRSFNAREMERSRKPVGIRNNPELRAAIPVLEEANWLWLAPPLPGQAGRHRTDYVINPAVFGDAP